jgi:general secretion pathway protein H
MSPSRIKYSLGFTLLELIIVMVLVVLSLGLAVAYYGNSLPSAQLRATGQQLSALIRQTRDTAQMTGEDATVVIDLDARQYGVDGKAMKAVPPEMSVWVEDSEARRITSGKYAIRLEATGGIEEGSVVLSYRRKSLTVRTDPIIGAILQ